MSVIFSSNNSSFPVTHHCVWFFCLVIVLLGRLRVINMVLMCPYCENAWIINFVSLPGFGMWIYYQIERSLKLCERVLVLGLYIDFNIFLDIQILKLLHSFFEIFYAFVFCRRILFLLFLTTNIWCLICLTIDDETQFVFAFRLKSLIEKLSWKQLKHCSIFR